MKRHDFTRRFLITALPGATASPMMPYSAPASSRTDLKLPACSALPPQRERVRDSEKELGTCGGRGEEPPHIQGRVLQHTLTALHYQLGLVPRGNIDAKTLNLVGAVRMHDVINERAASVVIVHVVRHVVGPPLVAGLLGQHVVDACHNVALRWRAISAHQVPLLV